jgi:phage tail-like protein
MLSGIQLDPLLTIGYRFVVAIDGDRVGAFTECTLPSFELEVETVKEGGLNSYVHQLPGPHKPARITLKNGIGVRSHMVPLYRNVMSGNLKRMQVTVTLANQMGVPVITLDIKDAYPVKWTGPQLKGDDQTVAIQTMELVCGEVTMDWKSGAPLGL